jgi:hypothetical protein
MCLYGGVASECSCMNQSCIVSERENKLCVALWMLPRILLRGESEQ